MPGCKVLLVEDDAELRRLYRTALTLTGCEVREASNGFDALRRLDSDPPDAVVLDLMIPVLSGFGVLSELSSQANLKNIPVIIVTGIQDSLDHLKVAAVLRKPVNLDHLTSIVRSVMRSG